MSDLKDRMSKQVAARAATPPTPVTAAVIAPTPVVAPFKEAPKPYPRRITLDLTNEDHRALKQAALDGNTTVADLLRSLVSAWRVDGDRRTRVDSPVR